VSIRLTCELCAAISLLSIQQHKGCTFLTLDVIDDEAPATVPARKP
jgi:hypothetical protein